MKSLHTMACATIALCLTHNVYADSKLFPTDILDKGDFDVQIGVAHQDLSFDTVYSGNPGTQHYDATAEEAEIRYGLGDNWHIGVGLAYHSQDDNKVDLTNPVKHFSDNSNQGFQNVNIWAKYGIINDASSPYSLSAELLLSPDTSGKQSTAYVGELTAGWKTSDTLRLFGELDHAVYTGDNIPDRTNLEFGAYKDFSENFTLIPTVGCAESQSTNTAKSQFQYNVGISSDIQIVKNTYLIPSIAYFSTGSTSNKSGTFSASSSNGKNISIALYHLF